MRTCKICDKNINHLNGNRLTCHECEDKNKVKRKYTEPVVTIPMSEFIKLKSDADLGKQVREIVERKMLWPIQYNLS